MNYKLIFNISLIFCLILFFHLKLLRINLFVFFSIIFCFFLTSSSSSSSPFGIFLFLTTSYKTANPKEFQLICEIINTFWIFQDLDWPALFFCYPDSSKFCGIMISYLAQKKFILDYCHHHPWDLSSCIRRNRLIETVSKLK